MWNKSPPISLSQGLTEPDLIEVREQSLPSVCLSIVVATCELIAILIWQQPRGHVTCRIQMVFVVVHCTCPSLTTYMCDCHCFSCSSSPDLPLAASHHRETVRLTLDVSLRPKWRTKHATAAFFFSGIS